jgi:hypothetical protein
MSSPFEQGARWDPKPQQSYSERQLHEAARDRLSREIAAVQRVTETEAIKEIEAALAKGRAAAQAGRGRSRGRGRGGVTARGHQRETFKARQRCRAFCSVSAGLFRTSAAESQLAGVTV